MAKKIIEFKQDTKSLLKRANAMLERGNYPAALSFMHKAQRKMPKDLDIALQIASTYGDMNLHDRQLKGLVRLLNKGREDVEVYREIIRCYFETNLVDQALYYYNEALERGVFDDEMIDELYESDYERVETPPRLHDKRDNSNIMQLSQKLILSGDYEFARELLETVPKSSYQHIDALNSLAIIALTEGNPDKAVEYSREVLATDDENVYAYSHLIMAYNQLGDSAKVDKTIKELLSLDITTPSELAVAAYSMQKIGNSEQTVFLLEKLIRLVPYSYDHLLVLAIANINCGKIRRARELLVRANNIFPDDVTINFYSLIALKEPKNVKFELIPMLPTDVVISWTNSIEEFIKSFDDGAFLGLIDDIMPKIYWVYQTDDWRLQSRLAAVLIQHCSWKTFFKNLLIDPGYDYRAKKETLRLLLTYSSDKNFDLFISDLYLNFHPRIPRGSYPKELEEAYWQVYSTLSFISIDFDSRLNKTFKQLIKTHEECGIENLKLNVKTLSALILYRQNMKQVFKNKLDCCEVFNCDLTEFEVYDDIFPLETKGRKKKKA